MEDNANVTTKNRRRGKKKLNKISFATETVTKSEAEELLKNLEKSSLDDGQNTNQKKIKRLKKNKHPQVAEDKIVTENSDVKTKSRTRRAKRGKKNVEPKLETQNEEKDAKECEETLESTTEDSSDEGKRKRKKSDQEDDDEEECGTENQTVKSDKSSGEKKASKRSIKRKKYEEMLKTKKKQSEDNLEKSCMEYLSNYKYNRDNWKFEKLKQIWLMDNLFNEDKIDDKLWDVVVDYFESSKGGVRKLLIDKALKIIEEGDLEEKNIEEGDLEETEGEKKDEVVKKVSQVKMDRARKVVQSLQE